MGEVADMTIDGTLCSGCGGLVDGESPGYPRWCNDCGGLSAEKADRRAGALEDFSEAAALAEGAGLNLRRCSEAHYQLRKPGAWLLQVYPGNGRLYDNQPPRQGERRPPFIRVSSPWNLVDVMRAAIEQDVN